MSNRARALTFSRDGKDDRRHQAQCEEIVYVGLPSGIIARRNQLTKEGFRYNVMPS